MNAERELLYLVGEPGVGKSTVMTELTTPWNRVCLADQPRRELLVDRVTGTPVGCELGARAGRHAAGYPGTDALPMNVVVAAEEWLVSGRAAAEAPLILAEGARLGVRRFLHAALKTGWRARVVLLTSGRAGENRRLRGSKQDERWVRGARTRAHRFFDYAAALDDAVSAHVVAADDLDVAVASVRRLAFGAGAVCAAS